ncbi:hypothetical protein KC332_g14217 [Hortaea werneckii]|uniref:Uncharacterized protein n=2 Tax=Hortaea werneckii TaxID=91943 RepID=A0A1Z5TFM8_HORWE|nr:hypothetical protein KC358_g16329 [Hortaea werneckii]OTA34805.1 hypothetical protein BTJ68_05351 [Hortaea werneckii EXF-2000]KAI6799804.1 hypothetical protein KC350_g16000 [Hortaea werneckii]KAI6907280.1 hypothetical protein KC348_g14293 [Hortaea werneckii]KAI6924470.1 hypothetical protein KC341_g14030 [Hortaea werneckii]
MPVLPHLLRRIMSPPSSQDTRALDARQLRSTANQAADSASRTARELLPRIISRIHPRQDANGNIIAIPTVYKGLNSGLSPGAVVGIVLGSVAGFLLILWLLWTLSNGGGFIRSSRYEEDDYYSRRSRSPRRRRRTEMRSRSPARRERDRIIRQERIIRDSQAQRQPSRMRETVIVDDLPRPERRVDGDDIVEVIEEHSSNGAPPRRGKGRRGSGYRRGAPGNFSDL